MSIGEENPSQAYLKGGLFVKTGVELPKAAVDFFLAEEGEVGGEFDGADG